MTPSIKTIAADIAEFLKAHQDKWTQNAFARDSNGEECNWRSPDACRCLEGHVMYRAALGIQSVIEGSRVADEALCEFATIGHEMGLFRNAATWNDAPGRTVADVIALCERVAGIDPTPCPQCQKAGEHKAGCERGTEP